MLCSISGSLALVLAAATAGLTGCYNADALIQQRREVVKLMRLEEVNLGTFRITLPPAAGASTHGVVEFEAFGQVANQHREDVEISLEQRGPELRHEMLMAIRQMSLEQLEEPSLQSLRQEVGKVVNEPLEGELVQRVGFYHFSFMPL